jgi:ribosome-interacting GTPase 1
MQQLEDTLAILHSFRIYSKACTIPENLRKPPKIKKMLVVVNKMDRQEDKETLDIFLELSGIKLPCVGISTRTGRNVTVFLDKLYELSGIIRVYTKPPGKEADRKSPFLVPLGSTLADLAGKVHNDFVSKLKYARAWGKSVRDGQMVQRDYVLHDGDVVELCI